MTPIVERDTWEIRELREDPWEPGPRVLEKESCSSSTYSSPPPHPQPLASTPPSPACLQHPLPLASCLVLHLPLSSASHQNLPCLVPGNLAPQPCLATHAKRVSQHLSIDYLIIVIISPKRRTTLSLTEPCPLSVIDVNKSKVTQCPGPPQTGSEAGECMCVWGGD